MNFLELVNEVARESGTMGGQTLGSVVAAPGRWAKLVQWTAQAWEMIQRERRDWLFMRKQFSYALVADQLRYTPAQLGITDFGAWEKEADGFQPYTLYDSAIGQSDEMALMVVNYQDWLARYDRGEPESLRPNVVTFDYDRKLCVGPPPDAAYVLRGFYRRSIQVLEANADEPYIHEDFHAAIVWRALMLLGDDDEAPFEIASSTASYRSARSAMLREYTEGISV